MKTDPPFYRRTPPALFPCLLGLIGLALLWRKMAEFGAPLWIGEALSVLSVGLFGFIFACYVTKLVLRPSVVLDDLKIGPARGAVSAGSVCLLLAAVIFVPYDFQLAEVLWWTGLAFHVVYLLCVVKTLKSIQAMRQSVTPVLLLPFVGFIVASIAGPQLDYRMLSIAFLFVCLPFYFWIGVESLLNAVSRGVEPINRPSYAIILAPPSIYAVAAYYLWSNTVFFWFWLIALIVGVCVLLAAPWMARGGFKPSWGAFTFPLTACTMVMALGLQTGIQVSLVPMTIGVTLSTLLVPYIVFKTLKAWSNGTLAHATKAAVA